MVDGRALVHTSTVKCPAMRVSGIVGNVMAGVAWVTPTVQYTRANGVMANAADKACYDYVSYCCTKWFVVIEKKCEWKICRYLNLLLDGILVDFPSRRALRSAVTNRLVVPSVRPSTVGSRAFPAAAPRIWNSLPEHVVTAATLQSFKKHLKMFLLQRSYSLAL